MSTQELVPVQTVTVPRTTNGRRRARVVDSTAHGINERLRRYGLAEKCAGFTEEILAFYAAVMRGDPIEVRRYNQPSLWDLPSLENRMTAAEKLLDRGFGRAPISIKEEIEHGDRKVIYEVHWLGKAPDDHSKVIEPEPD